MNRERRNVLIIKGKGNPFTAKKTGRNSLCKCGSGKKAKNCHGTETSYYDSKEIPKL